MVDDLGIRVRGSYGLMLLFTLAKAWCDFWVHLSTCLFFDSVCCSQIVCLPFWSVLVDCYRNR